MGSKKKRFDELPRVKGGQKNILTSSLEQKEVKKHFDKLPRAKGGAKFQVLRSTQTHELGQFQASSVILNACKATQISHFCYKLPNNVTFRVNEV